MSPLLVCFWNGRLVPKTSFAEFPSVFAGRGGSTKQRAKVLREYENVLTGTLFFGSPFELSQNKLTFMCDLKVIGVVCSLAKL
jgi:hypothetical protein